MFHFLLTVKEIFTFKFQRDKKYPTRSKRKGEKNNVYLDMILDILEIKWSYEVAR